MEGLSYTHMQHVSVGRFLDLQNPTERFVYYMKMIDWLTPEQQTLLINLVEGFYPRYGNLNPYALGLGFIATDKKDLPAVTKKSLKIKTGKLG